MIWRGCLAAQSATRCMHALYAHALRRNTELLDVQYAALIDRNASIRSYIK